MSFIIIIRATVSTFFLSLLLKHCLFALVFLDMLSLRLRGAFWWALERSLNLSSGCDIRGIIGVVGCDLAVPTEVPVPKLAILKKEKSLVQSWTQTQANLYFIHLWILKCIKRTSKQLVAQPLLGSLVKQEPTLSSVVGMNEGTKNTSYDHLFAATVPYVLADKTKSVSERLETILTQPTTRKQASSIARQVKEDETSRTIKLEDLAKLVSSVQPSFKDLDSPEDDPIIVVDGSDEYEEAYEVRATTNVETEDTLVLKSSSPRSSQI
nr:hypothetical protein [Tanacetum cinerariifolium]